MLPRRSTSMLDHCKPRLDKIERERCIPPLQGNFLTILCLDNRHFHVYIHYTRMFIYYCIIKHVLLRYLCYVVTTYKVLSSIHMWWWKVRDKSKRGGLPNFPRKNSELVNSHADLDVELTEMVIFFFKFIHSDCAYLAWFPILKNV